MVGLSVTKERSQLRFLWGVLLEDPSCVLRPGTSTLLTWDFPRGSGAVGRYVREALDRSDHFLFLEHAGTMSVEARENARNH